MCEWTPPYETSPSRCTSPRAALERADERRVLEEGAVLDRVVDAHQVLVEHAAGADRQMADLGVAHLPGGRPTASPEASSVVCGYSAQSRSKTGVSASSTALPGPGGAQPQPSRMTSATSG